MSLISSLRLLLKFFVLVDDFRRRIPKGGLVGEFKEQTVAEIITRTVEENCPVIWVFFQLSQLVSLGLNHSLMIDFAASEGM